MDVKGLTWIGNICDKIEAMCLEMEEVMYEDTVKYVENQVQTVGATVKKFYSDVMQDMHPESYVDPVKVAAVDLSLNPYAHSEMKLKASSKKDGREADEKLNDECKVISGAVNRGLHRRPIASKKANSKGDWAPLLPALNAPISEAKNMPTSFSQLKRSHEVASGHVLLPVHVTNEKISRSMVSPVLPMSRDSVISPATAGSAVGTELKQVDSASAKVDSPAMASTIRSPASTGLQKADCAPALVNSPDTATILSAATAEQKQDDCASICSSGGLASESSGICVKKGVVSQTEGTIPPETFDWKFFGEDIMLHKERLDGSGIDAAENTDAIDPEVEIVEPFNESLLEDTCVMVEGDKLHAVPQGKDGRKSYKKKLREAFSSKMSLTRKEYEQIAARYVEEESTKAGNAEIVSFDIPEDTSMEISAPHNCDSEWELL